MSEPDDDNPPEWYEQLERDIQKALLKDVSFFDRSWAKSAGLWDLVNTGRRYPNTVPVLLDWLERLDERVTHPHLRWEGVARHGLNRALVVDEAKGTRAVDLMIAQFHREPPLDKESLFTAGNALLQLAGPEHFDQIAEIVQSPVHGRSQLIEWLGKSRRKEALRIVADQLDNPEDVTSVLRVLRRKKLPPELAAEIRPKIERYLDYPGDKDKAPGEIRKQAKLTMAKLYPAA